MRPHGIHGVQMFRSLFCALPAREKYYTRHCSRNVTLHAADCGLGNLFDAAPACAQLSGDHHIRLQQHTLEQHAVKIKFGEQRFEQRFRQMESVAARRGIALGELDPAGWDALWEEAKQGVQS